MRRLRSIQNRGENNLGKRLSELAQARLKVCGFVRVKEAALSQTIDHAKECRELLFSFILRLERAEARDRRTRRFLVVAVMEALLSVLTDALFGRCVVSHGD